MLKSDFDIELHQQKVEMYFNSDYVISYTDGSCYHGDRKGGFGICIFSQKKDYLISKGPFEDTTTSRMEINAVLHTLMVVPKDRKLVIFSDSQYVVNAINDWMWGWDLDIRKNGDLFKKIILEIDLFREKPIISWVPGHFDIDGNEIADILSSRGRKA